MKMRSLSWAILVGIFCLVPQWVFSQHYLARHLATGMSSHPIGDDEELFFLDQGEVVLVMSPLHADVGLGRVADPHGSRILVDSWCLGKGE